MADLKIRADGHSLARLIMASGTIELSRDIPPGPDGWHSFSSMVDGLAAIKQRREEAQRAAAGQPSMTVDEAYETGRIHPRSLAEWQQRYDADPAGTGRVLASLSPIVNASERATPGQVWATGPDGHPVLAAGYTGHAPSRTPTLDAIEERLYGADREERWHREDLRAEAELREADRTERARVGLTDEELSQLFPTGRE